MTFANEHDNEMMLSNGPTVFVGGIGGSGTRVVANLLSKVGIDIGFDLNGALDNLSYTLFFKRPAWFLRVNRSEKERLFLQFVDVMQAGVYSTEELKSLEACHADMFNNGHNIGGAGKGGWATERMNRILDSGPVASSWGFKEPNSHLMADIALELFPKLKYIYVYRHGLDLAFSRNQQQLFNWWSLYGLPNPATLAAEKIPSLQLDYWIKVQRAHLSLQKRFSDKRVLFINYDEFVMQPQNYVANVCEFMGTDVPEVDLSDISPTSSIGRYKERGTGFFSAEQLRTLESLGCAI